MCAEIWLRASILLLILGAKTCVGDFRKNLKSRAYGRRYPDMEICDAAPAPSDPRVTTCMYSGQRLSGHRSPQRPREIIVLRGSRGDNLPSRGTKIVSMRIMMTVVPAATNNNVGYENMDVISVVAQ